MSAIDERACGKSECDNFGKPGRNIVVIRGLAKALGLPLPKGVRLRNPYVGSDGKTKLTLRGVATRFCELYGREKKSS